MSLRATIELVDLINRDLPAWQRLAVADPTAPEEGLWPAEADSVLRAVEKRRREFAAGRRAARNALVALGRQPQAIPMGPDRAPIWPKDVQGSITHTSFAAVALVQTQHGVDMPGLDLETDAGLPDNLHDEIVKPGDVALHANPALNARRMFSAKEAAYKAQFPLVREVFGFDGLRLVSQDGALAAQYTSARGPFAQGAQIALRQWCRNGIILSLALAQAPPRGHRAA